MILVALVYLPFIYSQQQQSEEYRPACYRLHGSNNQKITISFKTTIRFAPPEMEMSFVRKEGPETEPEKYKQELRLKLILLDEKCAEVLPVGWIEPLEHDIRNYTLTLYFGAQKHILDIYQFTLLYSAAEGVYIIKGAHDRSLIRIRVKNEYKYFTFCSYVPPLYIQKIPFMGFNTTYCLDLWNLLSRRTTMIQFLKDVDQDLPEYVIVMFSTLLTHPNGKKLPEIYNVTDLARLYICDEKPSKAKPITIYLQPALSAGQVKIQLFDPHNQDIGHSLYGPTETEVNVFKTAHSNFHAKNIAVTSYSLLSRKTFDTKGKIMFYRTKQRSHSCIISGKPCKIDEYYHYNIKLKADAICEVGYDFTNSVMTAQKIHGKTYDYCVAQSTTQQ